MNTVAFNNNTTVKEQKLILPGCYDWQQFKGIKTLIEQQPGVKISYLDGVIELMTLGEKHEIIKSIIAILLGIYFWKKDIEFIPVGSATRESEEKGVSFEPDESYYIGEKKEHPDLAIEVNITSGRVKKLERYKRFKIKEVWLWQHNKFSLYTLQDNEYKQIFQSQLLPELNFKLLEDCVLMSSQLEAIKIFTDSIH
ncbi:Uma2 family endonuclease [Crocosphaera sp.]|uniref:Uma2 family endonuclease n=1 Tax=Crocosphaera sp. TaxID=2729996 RepID=UPI00261673C8|nr:Uma2 family endonuclease [Crocosphaera sp.]MDJ0579839.1 Uma2 family endonuclease [Crocosphaera sp.]